MKLSIIILIVFSVCALGCGQDKNQEKMIKKDYKDSTLVKSDTSQVDPKSPHPKDMGIGPIKEVKLGAIDQNLVKKGQQLFETKCTICHSLDERKVGPPLRNVTQERTPEFIMNLLLNTATMENKDQIVEKLISEYHIPMPDQTLTEEQAREILEYLRQSASEKKQQ